MIERLIHEILTEGRDQLLEDENLRFLERFFKNMKKLGDTEVEAIKTFFRAHPPTVRHQYAREGEQVPSWNIILANEQEDERFLGDDVGIAGELIALGEEDELDWDPDEPDVGEDLIGSIWNKQYAILTYSEHPDITRYYYEIAKLILGRSRKYLEKEGELISTKFSGGDLAPDPAYIPVHMFVRQFVVELQVTECVVSSTGPERFTHLDGMHIDDGDSLEEKGGVESRITLDTTGGSDG